MTSSLHDHIQVAPHGGKLIERLADDASRPELLEASRSLPRVAIDRRTLSDVRLLGIGALSPLSGFMDQRRYGTVLEEMRLENGLVWSIPITLPVGAVTAMQLRTSERIALTYGERTVAVMDITDIFKPDKAEEATRVYGVDDPAHPGVKALYEAGETYIGGPVTVLDPAPSDDGELAEYQLKPRETREIFAERGWRRVVAFQTRNPIHRAHEYLQKCALEMVDGLLVHPLIGETKSDDLDSGTRFLCYRKILSLYYPTDRALLSAFPASMRYAGPKEALFHALCRKNYGCTHFIVGRDHAGVGNYYGTYDSQKIFDQFAPEEIGIEPLRFEHAFFCLKCHGMATGKTCPHGSSDHVFLSGTKVRQMVRRGEAPPPEFTRPEVAEILLQSQARGKSAGTMRNGSESVQYAHGSTTSNSGFGGGSRGDSN